MHLPVAFRSLSRLSSALSAKASTLRSFQLNHPIYSSVNKSWLFFVSCLLHIFVCLLVLDVSSSSLIIPNLQRNKILSIFGFQGTIHIMIAFAMI